MVKIKNSLSSKLLSMLLAFLMLIAMVPPTIVSVSAVTDGAVGVVEALVSGGTVDGSTVTFSGASLEWAAKNEAIGRWMDGWWIGIKVIAPTGEGVDLPNAKYQNQTSTGWGPDKSFQAFKDSKDEDESQYITLWGMINEGYLNDAIIGGVEYLNYVYRFDWDGDGNYDNAQVVTMRINPKDIKLNKEGVQQYPKTSELAHVDAITGGLNISGNSSNITTVETASNIVLNWVAANNEIGRTQDGWWIGYNVVAPSDADIENAKYQHKTSAGWGDANSFNEYKDTENSIGVWRLINETYLNSAVANKKNVNYTTRYDWDGDGVYEQIITLKIVPSKVTLIAENGEQVYPYLGTVTPLTGGTVSGNTSNLELIIDDTSLNWSAKDPSIGRNYDGWWVGMRVIAPEGYTVEQLKNSTYKNRVTSSGGTAWTEYTANKKFWDMKDSNDGDSIHYIGMWFPVNPSLLATYKTNGNDIKGEYVFDWDGNGVADQTITMIVDPDGNIVLNKVAQNDFAFIDSNPTDKWVGESYTNTASGGQGSGAVTYAITSGSDVADIDSETGELTFKKVGTVTVTATKAADETYDEATAVYTVKAIKYPQEQFKFENSNATITVEFASGSFINAAHGGSGEGTVKYSILSDSSVATIDENTGKITFIKAGEITVVATKAADSNYLETSATYILKIEKSEQEALIFEPSVPNAIIYADGPQSILNVSGGSGEGVITYSIVSGNEYASIDKDTGIITLLKAGGSFEVCANKAGDDGYNAAQCIFATITVYHAEQKDFAFADKSPVSITFNDGNNKFSNVASGGQSGGAITYAFKDAESEEIADIDATTGEITINAAGTVNVIATKAGDDCYNSITAEYSLTVNKGTPEFSVDNVDLIYGVQEYQINVNTTVGSANYIYSIEGANNIGAIVDENGKVTFENSVDKIGTITVNVKSEADNKYVEAEKSFTITVSYHNSVEQPTVDGETKNDTGWFTDSVVIKAPAGYTIAYDNKLSGTTWADELPYDKEGVNDAVVYLKSNEGYITDGITVADIKLDTGNPDATAINIEYDTPAWDKFLNAITFGIYKSDSLLVKLTAKDINSGIASLTYNIGGEDVVVPFGGEASVSHSFVINAQHRNEIVLTATDVAGRSTQKHSEHTIVLDTKVPEIEAAYDFVSGQHREYNDILYTQGDVNVILTITETNFDLSEAPVIKVNAQEIAVDWIKVDDTEKWQAEVALSDNGEYTVNVSFTDVATNKMVDFEQVIHIDDEAPLFDVTYSNNDARNENNYKADRVAVIKITEHNFNAEKVILNVVAKDITGAAVDISSKGYAEYARNAANWTRNGDVWTLNTDGMRFDVDAIYNISLKYTDLSENAATEYATEFVIDKTIANADNITVEYSTPIVDKILETITFGFYKGDVQVKVTVKDQTAGVEYFELTYTQLDGKNNSNKSTYTTEKITAEQDKSDKSIFIATHTISAQARGTVSVRIVDKAGNTTARSEDYVVVIDTIAPGLAYEWIFTDDQVREYNNIYYTKEDAKVKFIIEEANFDLSINTANGETVAPAPILAINGVAQDIVWDQVDGTDKWETEITLSGNGDYEVVLSYTDRSSNEMSTYTKKVHIDNVAPVFDVSYSNNEARNENIYKADRVATIKITEHNFKAEEVFLDVVAKDITGAAVDISSKGYAEYARNAANWTQNGDVWTLNTDGMSFDIDAIYSISLKYTDLSENVAAEYATEFVIDKSKSVNIEIDYSESIIDKVFETISFGFYKSDVTVTVTAQDDTAGVEYFEITYNKQEGTSNINEDSYTTEKLVAIQDATNKSIFTADCTIPANARGTVSVALLDKAGNASNADDPTVIVVDKLNPTREVIYTPYKILDAETMLEVDDYQEGDNSILYYKDSAVVTFKITEANFDLSLNDVATKPTIKVNDVPVSIVWSNDGDVWTASHIIEGDGDYVVKMTYADLSGNEMVEYNSCKIAIDSTVPVIDVSYSDGAPNKTIDAHKYYKTTQTINVTINEHNFRADDVVLTVTAKDIQGNAVDISSKQYTDYAKNRDNWTHNGDVHTLKTDGMVFDIDAIYTFDVVYDDIVDNFAEDYIQDIFVVDHKESTNLTIEYGESIVDKIIEAITFGFYKSEATVTISADDFTSGVDYFEWTYTKEVGVSNKNTEELGSRIDDNDIEYSENGLSAKATFKIPANARGFITATVTDKSGNSTTKTDKNNISIVVDNIAPTISVNYKANSGYTKVQFTDDKQATVNTFADATYAYYNGDVTARIVINEANFFEGADSTDGIIHNVGIKLTKTDNNGNDTVYEYLPSGAAQKYPDATPKYITWNHSGDEHSFNINYAENADYVLEIEYTDFSTNDASISANDGNTATKYYKSKVITVDKIAPVVDVKYGNKKIVHTIDGRDYFGATQTVTITVEEHNFRADDFVATVVAQDILKADVKVENFKATLSDASKWTKNGNTYTITIKFSADANYSFDYEYEDLAKNAAAAYDEKLFTVDKTAPKHLTVSYSQSIADKIIETITFGYYNSKVTVTITAEDDTSSIHRFEYAYLRSEGVSSVNAEVLKAAIKEAEFTVEGNKAIATFEIPKDVLERENQFNGTIKFVAFDRSENNTERADSHRVIVDNIAPTAVITYNAPVQKVNDISYYNGNIDAKIVINEANFYREDVVVKVNDKVAAVKWVDDSADVHTGTFTLAEDGDYIVTVEYKDRSENEMSKYTSNRLTLDSKAPTVNVTRLKNNSANKDARYDFTITANDINLDAASFNPVLTAIVRNDDGTYGTKLVSLGDMKTVEDGKTYAFAVDNLVDDAVYTLVCTLKDMSGNEYSKVVLSDGKEYDEVRFSINRNGSTFAVDKKTDDLVNQYYVYSVEEDVVIEEINVDPVETYVVKLNGKALTEGTDYTTTASDETEGAWSKRTYVISKDLFKSEGEYSIVVESIDKVGSTAYSDVKNLNVSFVVDQTVPVLTISGLENGGRYQVEEQTVTVIPTDDGGRLYSIKVVALDSDGEPLTDADAKDISLRFEMSGEELLAYLTKNNGKITFTIPAGLENQVQIICNDSAVNADGNANEYNETYTKVTVSQSGWIIFYANKPLFYGSIAGLLLLSVGVIFLIFLKKRKKETK